jgi:calcium-translocating P-type ATPase
VTTRQEVSRDERGFAGLSAAEAAERLARFGRNVLPTTRPPSVWRQVVEQMAHFFAIMLWIASGLAMLAGMPQLAVAIAVVVIVNGLFAFFQEYRAERAALKLRNLLPRRATVVRDGQPIEINADELVVDDLVLLAAGDRISADLRVVEAHSLFVDTSTLTGESVPVMTDVGDTAWAGTFVVSGEARAVVMGIGQATRLAGIAQLTQAAQRSMSPLSRELHRLVRITAAVAVGVGVIFLGVAALIGIPTRDAFLFAVGVMVALVPEGLLPTITLSLAMGAQRMAERRALVRRLESVETLGSTTFICTDKTGTLTRNEMAVVEVWTPGGSAAIRGVGYEPTAEVIASVGLVPAVHELATAARQCSSGRVLLQDDRWVAQGDPMEAAIDAFARRVGVDPYQLQEQAPVTRRYPFDSQRRRMSVMAGPMLYVKGAPDDMLPRCWNAAESGAATALEALTARGLRVLAVAVGDGGRLADDATADDAERDLRLVGLLGLEDPPRSEVREALEQCRTAGVRVAMVTGDHPATARAIAVEVGLMGPDAMVLEGRNLPSDDVRLGELIDRDGVVISRVSPEDKLRIARALRARGHVVAMTGDGVNDGPALEEADIGVAMGRCGTDVAREAADLVLLDDNFETIVAAIEHGRATFANIRRFLTYHLTDNVAELTPFVAWALSGGTFPLAIGVLQVLALDIGTDLLPALALGAEPPRRGVLTEAPTRLHLLDRSVLLRVFGVLGPVEAVVEMAAFVAVLTAGGWLLGDQAIDPALLAGASGAAFATVVLGQLGNAFACRSTSQAAWRLGWTTNPLMLWAVAAEVLLLAAFLLIPAVATPLGHQPPPLLGWAFALSAPLLVLAADALHKKLRAIHQARSGAGQ